MIRFPTVSRSRRPSVGGISLAKRPVAPQVVPFEAIPWVDRALIASRGVKHWVKDR